MQVRAAQLPYAFQLWNDEKNRQDRPTVAAHGELEMHAGCDGPKLGSVELPAQAGDDGFSTFRIELASDADRKPVDLCFWFTGDTRPTYWAIDAVELMPAD